MHSTENDGSSQFRFSTGGCTEYLNDQLPLLIEIYYPRRFPPNNSAYPTRPKKAMTNLAAQKRCKQTCRLVDELSPEGRKEYETLRQSFHQIQTTALRDRHPASFLQEVMAISAFIERRADEREKRALAAGLSVSALFICVNTRQLKQLIGRCKSSINNGFQQLGYTSLKTKSKARSILHTALPSLSKDIPSSRQWTIRFAKANSFIFTPPSPPPQPSIKPGNLPIPIVRSTTPVPVPILPSKPKEQSIFFDITRFDELYEDAAVESFGSLPEDIDMGTSLFGIL